ncbi:MAG: hypothetical protein Q7R52_02430 [archaeon]|nr:hypothetical protein [archaeon]
MGLKEIDLINQLREIIQHEHESVYELLKILSNHIEITNERINNIENFIKDLK